MEKIFKEACYELMNYPNRNMKYRVKNLLKKILKRGYSPADYLNWPNGLLSLGIMEYARKNDSKEAMDILKAYFDRWIDKGSRIYFLDDALSGETLIKLYLSTGDEKYISHINKIYDYLAKALKDSEGSLIYRPSQGNGHILADMIGMVCPFLCLYGRTFNNPEAAQLAYTQIDNFLVNAIDSASGLPYHGYEKSKELSYGIIGWGRAVGWLMLGISGVINYADEMLPLSKIMELKKKFYELTRTVMNMQRENGGFAWQLGATKGQLDTSATAMIYTSIVRSYTSKDISLEDKNIYANEFLPEIKKGFEFLMGFVADGKVYDCEAECLGFGMYPQIYGSYPWSVGSMLYLGSLI